MVVLYCPWPQRHRLWGELWWVEGQHRWIFFDDLQNSETYAEQVEYCPGCGRPLKREGLRMIGLVEGMFENRGQRKYAEEC